MTEDQRKGMIEDCLKDFDFEKVHKVMYELGWTWDMTKDYVPSIYEIVKLAEMALRNVTVFNDGELHEYASGGLRAVCDENENIELRFELETSAGFIDDHK